MRMHDMQQRLEHTETLRQRFADQASRVSDPGAEIVPDAVAGPEVVQVPGELGHGVKEIAELVFGQRR